MNKNIKAPGYLVVERDLLLDNRLSNTAKLLYAYIVLLTNNASESCYATNRYLAKVFDVSISSIKRYLNELQKTSYITINISDDRRCIKTISHIVAEHRDEIMEMFDYNWLDDDEEKT